MGQGNDPVLRFGRDFSGGDDVGRTELSQRPLADGPLVFANACTTATIAMYRSDPTRISPVSAQCPDPTTCCCVGQGIDHVWSW